MQGDKSKRVQVHARGQGVLISVHQSDELTRLSHVLVIHYTNLREEKGAGKHLLVCEVISSK